MTQEPSQMPDEFEKWFNSQYEQRQNPDFLLGKKMLFDVWQAAWNTRAESVPSDKERDEGDPLFNKRPNQDEIEAIILRRLREGRIDGYTIEMAHEIAALTAPDQSETIRAFKLGDRVTKTKPNYILDTPK